MNNLPITPSLEVLLREHLATGKYPTATDVVATAIQLMESHPQPVQVGQDKAFGIWKDRELDGLAYQRKIRAEWGV